MPLRLLSLLLLFAAVARAGSPAYFGAALAQLGSEVPPGWAYTLTTTRESDTTVERYDPSRPKDEQWTLVSRNGQVPTADEIKSYRSYKTTNAPSMRATFQRGDIDTGQAVLLREDAAHATFRCPFREDVDDPLLKHMAIELTVAKQPPLVEKSVLQLKEPFSPIIGIKMTELRVEMTFSPPADGHPGLPLSAVSHFRGRLLLFKSIAEDLRVTYSEFVRLTATAPQNPPQ